jgi:hypothetical protein
MYMSLIGQKRTFPAMKFNYSIKLPAAVSEPQPEQLHPYDYNEFSLSLPADWKQLPTGADRTFNWYSDKAGAGITVSADFYEVPEAKWAAVAEVNLNGRHRAFEDVSDGSVNVVQRSVKPYSGGGGLELSYVAHDSRTTYLYLGYVTSRKVFNFTLTCGADKAAAVALYNRTMADRLRVTIP